MKIYYYVTLTPANKNVTLSFNFLVLTNIPFLFETTFYNMIFFHMATLKNKTNVLAQILFLASPRMDPVNENTTLYLVPWRGSK